MNEKIELAPEDTQADPENQELAEISEQELAGAPNDIESFEKEIVDGLNTMQAEEAAAIIASSNEKPGSGNFKKVLMLLTATAMVMAYSSEALAGNDGIEKRIKDRAKRTERKLKRLPAEQAKKTIKKIENKVDQGARKMLDSIFDKMFK